MKIGIYTNLEKDLNLNSTKHLIKSLKKQDFEVYCYEKMKIENEKIFNFEKLPKLDVLIVLGGDGTILSVTNRLIDKEIKILGINTGNLGFLSEFEQNQIDEAVEMLRNEDYYFESRDRLSIIVNGKEYSFLNEAAILRENSLQNAHKVITINCFVNDTFLDKVVADGVIVSTSTGSTAYSLSAGGPLLSPNIKGFLITSICAHSLHNRPLVLSLDEVVKMKVEDNNNPILLVLDGKIAQKISSTDDICVKYMGKTSLFLRKKDGDNFYNKLLLKLNKWSTT